MQDSTLTYDDLRFFLSTLENITALSDNWSYISSMMTTLKNSMSCFDVNRFIAVSSEAELETTAAKLFENGTFLMGLVFDNLKPNDIKSSNNFSVKMRMNIDNVPETNLIRPW